MSIERIGVVGAGQMGSGIAEVSAKAGAHVVVYEPTDELVAVGRKRITGSLERAAGKGKLTEADRDAALARLTFTTDLADLSDRQLVIEAVVEDETVKAKIFAELDEIITDPDAVLASNTSSIPIMKLAAATQNPSRVLGLHFFNPVPVLPLVELVRTLVTSDARTLAHGGVRRLGAGQAGGALQRPIGIRRQCAAGAVPAVGDPHGGGGVRDRRGRR